MRIIATVCIALLWALGGSFLSAQSFERLPRLRAALPEIGLVGYSAFAIARDIDSLDRATIRESGFGCCALVSDALVACSASLHLYNNFYAADEETRRKLRLAARIGYLSALAPSLAFAALSPEAEGEDRLGLALATGIPAVVGLLFTFLPYP